MGRSERNRPATQTPRSIQVASGVIREIRQHAHSSSKVEICGVLLGSHTDGSISITAAIAGKNAEQGGAHVTFTQETWAHIFKIKDRDYSGHRILGWYHSHPGFGVFLSEHDTFIHRNFFSDPSQVAWVYDPHSDEEGCFGWNGERIERLASFTVVDDRGGELADYTGKPETVFTDPHESTEASNGKLRSGVAAPSTRRRLERILSNVLSHAVALILGLAFAWYVMPRVLVVAVPVDPQTGLPVKLHSPVLAGPDGSQRGSANHVH